MFMRRSKFKHVFGKPNKKEFCYEDIRITKSSWDSTFCSVNPKYISIITEAAGGGAFLVHPIEKFGRVERDAALVAGHKAAVLDIQWCPHDDDLIASASDDCTVKVWKIPKGGLEAKNNLTEPVADLVAHQRRVGLIVWHPTAEHVLLSAGTDNLLIMWNVSTGEPMVEIHVPDIVFSASFNYDGSKLVITCKDRVTRVIDPRTGKFLAEGHCHSGSKPQQACYLKNGKIFTTGFTTMSERQLAIWKENDLSNPLHVMDLDTSNGVLFIFYDPDTSLVFLCGKGDSTIRYFEITEDDPYIHYIDMFNSSDPQRGMGWMPKRGLNVNNNEIARFYKLHAKGLCEVIPFTVPRKSELFQDDLYPDTAGDMPALSAEDWFSGQNSGPILVSLKDGFQGKEKATKKLPERGLKSDPAPKLGAATTTSVTEKSKSDSSQEVTANGAQHANNGAGAINPEDVKQLLDDMRKMKIIIKGHERRIKYLEDCMSKTGELEK
ncbi:Coronin-6 [Cichlidogyrus casuarinus]|uniref:Coronin n=1 Tax=Cichlidogyrus casuarinus TaxID=1844966 RepID=A0ABD2QA38_9PLAT